MPIADFMIAKTSVIKADGKDYAATGIDGMDFDEQVWMPDSGIIHFTMTFPAIPATAESIDFSEGTDDGWQLWGIDLTGKAGHNINTARLLVHAVASSSIAAMDIPAALGKKLFIKICYRSVITMVKSQIVIIVAKLTNILCR